MHFAWFRMHQIDDFLLRALSKCKKNRLRRRITLSRFLLIVFLKGKSPRSGEIFLRVKSPRSGENSSTPQISAKPNSTPQILPPRFWGQNKHWNGMSLGFHYNWPNSDPNLGTSLANRDELLFFGRQYIFEMLQLFCFWVLWVEIVKANLSGY